MPDVAPNSRSQGPRWFRLRFRLRTLLLLVASLCIWLTWQAAVARRQQKAVEIIRQYGGNVIYDFNDRRPGAQPAAWRAWLARTMGDEYVFAVVGVGLSGPAVDDRALATLAPHLARLRRLRWLDVDDVPITNAGLKHLGQIWRLQRLFLRAQGFQTPQLCISDDGLAFLAELTSLEFLAINNAPVTGTGLTSLRNLPVLASLDLRSTDVGDAGLQTVGTLHQLQRLKFAGMRCTDASVRHLRGLHALVELSFQESQLSDDGVVHLLELTNLQRLDVSQSRITDHGLTRFAGLPDLRELAVYRTNVTDAGVARLSELAPRLVIER